MNRHLFLSPHFDDAIFSCGGTIAQLQRDGQAVTIITVMGGGLPVPLPDTPLIQELHARWKAGDDPIMRRQAEDQAAVAHLGATLLSLPIPDCIYRTAEGQALYPDALSLWGDIHPQDKLEQWLGEAESLHEVLMSAQFIYAPLGVGNHVDHQIVQRWGLHLVTVYPHLTLQFYTDFPYMKDSSKISAALLRVETTMQPRWIYLSHEDIQRKVEAMACYASQISTFWTDHKDMKRDVELSFRVQPDLWGERYWAQTAISS